MAEIKYHLRRAGEIISRILYITIATVRDDGQPWNSPVYSAFDDELNFYWASDKNGQHSKNVRNNPKIFLAIYDSTVPEGTGEGVYILAEAEELTEIKDIIIGCAALQGRKGKMVAEPEADAKCFTGEGVRRIYKAVPKQVWMNDDEKDENKQFVRDIRVEIPLDELLKQMGFHS